MDALRLSAITLSVLLGLIVAEHSHEENKRILLENEPNVDIGGEIAQLRALLLDQQKLITAMQKDLQVQKNATTDLKHQESTASQTDSELRKTIATLQTDLELQKNITANLQQDLINKTEALKHQEMEVTKGSGSVYIRWGRTDCPTTATFVYTGFTAGNHYNEAGSGSDNICLPSDPTWSRYTDGPASVQRANVYGGEIDTPDQDHIFNRPVNEQDMPCTVCRSNRSSTVMIPARNNCYAGWTMEYNGYLMAGLHGYQATSHVCMDENPEFLNGGGTNDNQHILYLAQGVCGSLPCPPYVNGRELACVVCSK